MSSARDEQGWSNEKLAPLIEGLLELLPWLKQWHNEIDPEYNQRMGDFFESFIDQELHRLGDDPRGRRNQGRAMTLIRDLIEIPERVHGGDFVLKLSEGVARRTRRHSARLRGYAATGASASSARWSWCARAVMDRQSKGIVSARQLRRGQKPFHGSARSAAGGQRKGALRFRSCRGVVAHNSAWIEGKKFLLVPYHLDRRGSAWKAAILGHYAEYVKQVRSRSARHPVCLAAEKIFADAREMRDAMGDEAFFRQMNRRHGDNGDGGLRRASTRDPTPTAWSTR